MFKLIRLEKMALVQDSALVQLEHIGLKHCLVSIQILTAEAFLDELSSKVLPKFSMVPLVC